MGLSASEPSSGTPQRSTAAAPLLELRSVGISFRTARGHVAVTRDVSLSVSPGEKIGLVGESGCGKTVTGLSILRLLPPQLAKVSGEILFEGRDLLQLSARDMRKVRGRDISMIFQEPMTALDPVYTIGEQIEETIRAHRTLSAREVHELAVQALADVGIPSPEKRCHDYPHQLSGGMRQRVMIAIALACQPKLLIADEPTTALDVTIQAQIVDLLLACSERAGTALLFITHDLGVIAQSCSRVVTMYAGEVVEDTDIERGLRRPLHPYTSGLLRSIPRLSPANARLPSIPGVIPAPAAMPEGCRFEPRCNHAQTPCGVPQTLATADAVRRVRCCRYHELELPGSVS